MVGVVNYTHLSKYAARTLGGDFVMFVELVLGVLIIAAVFGVLLGTFGVVTD